MHLTIITKAPVPGRVKTRLCPPCTPEQAAEVFSAALADTFDAIDATVAACAWRVGDVRRVVLLDGERGEFLRAGYDVVAQRGDGLGERLGNGFADLGAGVIVGMETPAGGPWLGDALVAVADGYDAIGLACDGGYWAIGLAEPNPVAFEGVPMSCDHTGVSQLLRLHSLGRPVRLLPMLRDLDTFEDLRSACNDHGRLGEIARRLVEGGGRATSRRRISLDGVPQRAIDRLPRAL